MRQAHAQNSCVLTYIYMHKYERILCFLLFEQLLSYVWMDKDNFESSFSSYNGILYFPSYTRMLEEYYNYYNDDGGDDNRCYGSYPTTLKEY